MAKCWAQWQIAECSKLHTNSGILSMKVITCETSNVEVSLTSNSARVQRNHCLVTSRLIYRMTSGQRGAREGPGTPALAPKVVESLTEAVSRCSRCFSRRSRAPPQGCLTSRHTLRVTASLGTLPRGMRIINQGWPEKLP